VTAVILDYPFTEQEVRDAHAEWGCIIKSSIERPVSGEFLVSETRLMCSGSPGVSSTPATLTTAPPLARGHVMAAVDCTPTYRPIPDFPDYYAGCDGSIWSAKNGHERHLWRRMRDRLSSGHRVVNLCRAGCKYTFFVHRLVMWAFHGPCPDGMEVAHGNGNPTVIELRRRYANGESKNVLICDYRIGRRGLERILRRERWAHVA
jgi:hypothetical protein